MNNTLNHYEHLIHGFLTSVYKIKNRCHPRQSYIAKQLNISTRTVKRHIKSLIQKGYLKIKRMWKLNHYFPSSTPIHDEKNLLTQSPDQVTLSHLTRESNKYKNKTSLDMDYFYAGIEKRLQPLSTFPMATPIEKSIPLLSRFAPNGNHVLYCKVNGLELEREHASFVSKNKARGTLFKSVDGAFHGWLRKAKEFLQSPPRTFDKKWSKIPIGKPLVEENRGDGRQNISCELPRKPVGIFSCKSLSRDAWKVSEAYNASSGPLRVPMQDWRDIAIEQFMPKVPTRSVADVLASLRRD